MVYSIIQNFRRSLKYRGGWKGLFEHMYTVSQTQNSGFFWQMIWPIFTIPNCNFVFLVVLYCMIPPFLLVCAHITSFTLSALNTEWRLSFQDGNLYGQRCCWQSLLWKPCRLCFWTASLGWARRHTQLRFFICSTWVARLDVIHAWRCSTFLRFSHWRT